MGIFDQIILLWSNLYIWCRNGIRQTFYMDRSFWKIFYPKIYCQLCLILLTKQFFKWFYSIFTPKHTFLSLCPHLLIHCLHGHCPCVREKFHVWILMESIHRIALCSNISLHRLFLFQIVFFYIKNTFTMYLTCTLQEIF